MRVPSMRRATRGIKKFPERFTEWFMGFSTWTLRVTREPVARCFSWNIEDIFVAIKGSKFTSGFQRGAIFRETEFSSIKHYFRVASRRTGPSTSGRRRIRSNSAFPECRECGVRERQRPRWSSFYGWPSGDALAYLSLRCFDLCLRAISSVDFKRYQIPERQLWFVITLCAMRVARYDVTMIINSESNDDLQIISVNLSISYMSIKKKRN